ncbi:RICIN domain-containing protein [Nocardia sp. SYP-A9097]|uniref:RICIN domain-containing protein n=1 Tax=Nocardia sp. SYP-A9097 TaxID=2663237 RepID=UPI001E625E17|nr:RICIN domain-containing protein [Nocardia sp. SYP-A9097]
MTARIRSGARRSKTNRWTLQNVETDKYLRPAEGRISDGCRVVAGKDPFWWHIFSDEDDLSSFRLYVPDQATAFNVEVADHGNPLNGTPVQLWGKWSGANQRWRIEQV